MNFKTKATALGAVLALTVGATSALASQSSVNAPAVKTAAKASLGQFGIQGARYVALDAPCRIIDTRVHNTPLLQSIQQGFKATGALTGQGGEPSCISVATPAIVSSITASVSMVAKQTGYLRFGKGDAIPLATELNYQGGQSNTTGTTIPLCTTVNCNHEFSVEAIQGTGDLVVDVQGYFIRPMAGQVEGDTGVLDNDASSGVISSTLTNTGHYTLTGPTGFDLSQCAINVTPEALGNRWATIQTNEGTPQANQVDVYLTQQIVGVVTNVNTSFDFNIEC